MDERTKEIYRQMDIARDALYTLAITSPCTRKDLQAVLHFQCIALELAVWECIENGCDPRNFNSVIGEYVKND